MEFNPYSKEYQLRNLKEKDKPKYKPQRHSKKKKRPKVNKNIQVFHNRKIPHWKQRGAVSKKEAIKVLNYWGEACVVCKNPKYQLHHIKHKGYGIGGRGVWRNLIPLCEQHHTGELGVHTIPSYDRELQERQEKLFGQNYYKDCYDLWMEGIIENPTLELHEKFMEEETKRAESR